MELISADDLIDQLGHVIKRATDELKPFQISSPHGTVILLPEETYKNILVTLEVLSTPGLLEALKSSKEEI